MYLKIALLLNVALAFAQNNCECSDAALEQSLQESNDIVTFLNRLTKKEVDEERKYPVVPPAVITGALGCACGENLRRKRKIMPKEDIPLIDKPQDKNNLDEALPARISNRNCPVGYIRVLTTCIQAEDMLYK